MSDDSFTTWLAALEPRPPAALAAALSGATAGTAPAELTGAALAALRRALALGDVRRAAWELLAADALLTCAIERAAEQGRDSLDQLLGELGPSAFAPLLESEQP